MAEKWRAVALSPCGSGRGDFGRVKESAFDPKQTLHKKENLLIVLAPVIGLENLSGCELWCNLLIQVV